MAAARGVLERVRPAVVAQRDRLAVEHDAAHRQRQRGLHDPRHPLGDVVERAAEDGDVVAVAVDLRADAVELPLDRGRAQLLHRDLDVGSGGGEHRPDAAADLQPDLAQRGHAAGHRGRGDVAEVAVQHHRAAQLGGRHLRGLGGGVGHHALERALAHPARQQRAEEALLALGGAREQLAQSSAARALRAGPAQSADARERRVDFARASAPARPRAPAAPAAPPTRPRSAAAAARRTGTRPRSRPPPARRAAARRRARRSCRRARSWR